MFQILNFLDEIPVFCKKIEIVKTCNWGVPFYTFFDVQKKTQLQHSSAIPIFKTVEDSGGKKVPAQGDLFSCPEKNIFLPRKKFFQALKKKAPNKASETG